MNHKLSLFITALLAGCLIILSACGQSPAAPASPEARDVLFQVSSLDALMAGNYDGIASAAEVAKRGDFGIGTFDGLDGEMVMLDGNIYQVKDSGAVLKVDAGIKMPFLAATFFDSDRSAELGEIENLDALKASLDSLIEKKDRFYAVRVDGVFGKVKVRSVPRQQKPYPILSEVTKNQPVFDYENVKGSLVGFWCPEYVGSVNVPGYHLHFISEDHSKGGHLLEVSFEHAAANLDETRFFEMVLGEGALQESGIENAEEEMKKVEQ